MPVMYIDGKPLNYSGLIGPDGNPIGTVINFMGLKAPKDYLICDGSIYKISDYPNLANFFKDQFGSETYFGGSDGTFAVPDMRNLFLRGYHGNASESLSGDVGKKQEGTSVPWISSGSSNAFALPSIEATTSNADSVTTGADRRLIRDSYATTQTGTFGQRFTSRPVNMAVLYCIKAIDSQTVYETIEEYDTTVDDCEWHVRKWSNGLCEFMGNAKYTGIDITNPSGSIYTASADNILNGIRFPIPLKEKYVENVNISDCTSWIFPMFGNRVYNPFEGSPRIVLATYGAKSDCHCTVQIFVIGRWKEETVEVIERVTSEVLPKTSGTITKGGKQYDYELPGNLFASGSSATSFNGIGSSAKF